VDRGAHEGGHSEQASPEGAESQQARRRHRQNLRIDVTRGVHGMLPPFGETGADSLLDTAVQRTYGLPLRVFHRRCKLLPYLPMELLASQVNVTGFLVGSSNRFLAAVGSRGQNGHPQVDVVANAETGDVEVLNEDLRAAAALSVRERQFVDELLSTLARLQDEDGVGQEACSAWSRQRFQEFTHSLLQVPPPPRRLH
jgi:hypothetical protein